MAPYRGDYPLKTVAVELHRAEIARTNPAGVALLETHRSALPDGPPGIAHAYL